MINKKVAAAKRFCCSHLNFAADFWDTEFSGYYKCIEFVIIDAVRKSFCCCLYAFLFFKPVSALAI